MNRSVRLGAFLAPLTAPLVYLAWVMIFVPDGTPKHERTWEAALAALSLLLIPASYVVSLMFGAPLIFILRRLGRLSFGWVLALAVPLGALALTCLLLAAMASGATVRWDQLGWQGVASILCAGGALGAVIGAAFCLLAGITRAESP